jgi:hypothetical protein
LLQLRLHLVVQLLLHELLRSGVHARLSRRSLGPRVVSPA